MADPPLTEAPDTASPPIDDVFSQLTQNALRLVRRRILTPISFVFVALALVLAAGPNLPNWVVFAPFAISVVVLGLPHGALDHLVPARLSGRRPSIASIASVVGLYVVLGAAVLLLWATAPALGFVGFIALTWFHWGQGDLWLDVADSDHAGRLRARILRAGTVIVRGGLPMLVPLLADPGTYERVRVGTMGLFTAAHRSGASAVLGSAVLGSTGRLVAGIAFAALVLAMAAVTWLSARTRPERIAWARDQAEVLILGLFFTLGPPVLTIGLYFCFWHSLRHIVRLEMLDPRCSVFLARGEFAKTARRFVVDAAPITAIALVVLVATYLEFPPSSGAPEAVLAPYLVLISALTVPHVVIVAYMDYRQRVWTRFPSPRLLRETPSATRPPKHTPDNLSQHRPTSDRR